MNICEKIQLLIKEQQLPWFIQKRIKKTRNTYYWFKNQINHCFKPKSDKALITYVCGFHGETGGAIAAASIANLLATQYRVEFVTPYSSDINPLLSKAVKQVKHASFNSSVFICDAECEHAFYQKIKAHNIPLIISCHCLPEQLHGLEPAFIVKSLTYADKVHFVSAIQQVAFGLNNQQCKVIPNTSQKINKTQVTNNTGCVGNLSDSRKNAAASIDITLASNANAIHLWCAKEDIWKNEQVVVHQWETDKEKIYNSFDVLVFMSQLETFGLVVIEAMSAGIPCLLSDIPVFQQFSSCPGVIIVNENKKEQAVNALNELLLNKENLSQEMMNYFNEHYSTKAVFNQWDSLVKCILKQ